ncbi:hypothetical protein ACFQ7J_37395 [Streptomyces sp. NPDC056501]
MLSPQVLSEGDQSTVLITTEEGGAVIKVWQVWAGGLALLAAYVGYVR